MGNDYKTLDRHEALLRDLKRDVERGERPDVAPRDVDRWLVETRLRQADALRCNRAT